ncbi:hypothetical protein Y032_0116g574 [Ancylostoma ceylanicum]|uniref:Uncharacterized protein n=1 Tax=Ancylostoma ceylanicum TaxID=53326 RepID=A0A016TCG9_9BILA|nr:hypothetical protein Y032_0116g574 [Ancylostoma ceylanicum]
MLTDINKCSTAMRFPMCSFSRSSRAGQNFVRVIFCRVKYGQNVTYHTGCNVCPMSKTSSKIEISIFQKKTAS